MAKKTAKPTKKSTAPLHIGIDLGTSRSAVVASNGKRTWVESYVAWPKDFVARKMLGEAILFGEHAVENRLSVDLVRPLENGVIRDGTERDEEAVRELIHHLIEQVEPKDGQPIHAAVGVPAEALKVNKLAIRDAVKAYADALMVVSEPFAVAYGLDALTNALVIDIGAGTVDFCVMHGTMPTEEDQRTLTMAGDFVDRQLHGLLEERHPEAKFSDVAVRHFKEQHGYVGSENGKLAMTASVGGKITDVDVSKELREACEAIIPAIVETAIELVARYEPDFQEVVKKNIFLAGGGSQIKGIAEAVEDGLKEYGPCRVRVVDDPLFAGAEGALALAQDMPEAFWEDM
ncbi:MAG: MamK family actin-like protein [Bacteroidota bacterium]